MESLVYPRERTLGALTLVLGVLVWLLLAVGTVGIVFIYLLMGFLAYLFAQSALIAYVRHTGVRLSPQQMPDLHARFEHCCRKLGVDPIPEAYVLQGGGMLNAFAARFLGRYFVVLLSDVVDAMEPLPDGVNFYIGHELGHIRMKHATGHLWRMPVLWLPLVGAAYSRAKESTCDRHGLACCEQPESAARALAVLAAGSRRWQTVDLREYARQAQAHHGFWSGFHELVGAYPWLTKRVARVLQPDVKMPGRNPLAYLMALFVPNGGRLGSSGGFILLVAMVGVLAAVAIPAYQDYTAKAAVAQAWTASQPLRQGLAAHYEQAQQAPESLEQAGVAAERVGEHRLSYDAERMVVTLALPRGELMLVPELDDAGKVRWTCQAGEGLKAAHLPPACRGAEGN